MKIPSFKRIFKNDYKPEFQDLIQTLSLSINNGMEVVFDALNRKISLSDNVLCSVKDVEVTVDANGKPTVSTAFVVDIDGKIQGTMVINAQNLTNSSIYPTGAIFISFEQQNKIITINNVTGLKANNLYRLRVVAFG